MVEVGNSVIIETSYEAVIEGRVEEETKYYYIIRDKQGHIKRIYYRDIRAITLVGDD